jgi:very-short-patch-repair endonuclease
MRDLRDRRFGDPDEPIIQLHHIPDGRVSPGTQENEREAEALVAHLLDRLLHPGYDEATFGVLCLFEQQMRLVADLVIERVPEDLRSAHELVVINPDGFQGDERDIVYYSLSYDKGGMTLDQLSARQANREHIQGMLNVAFTRPRDEVHVFHTAPISAFAMASGEGRIRDWLLHCEAAGSNDPRLGGRTDRVDSEFEAEVIQALRESGIDAISQYPSCGFLIDIVAELEGRRVAIECDGEIWHLDEQGQLRLEDLHRQEILERAGWDVLRVPYRAWRQDPARQVARIVARLQDEAAEPEGEAQADVVLDSPRSLNSMVSITRNEAALILAVKEGAHDIDEAMRSARGHLGYSRLGSQIRLSLDQAISSLERRGLLKREDDRLFLSGQALNADVTVPPPVPTAISHLRRPTRGRRPRNRNRRYYR